MVKQAVGSLIWAAILVVAVLVVPGRADAHVGHAHGAAPAMAAANAASAPVSRAAPVRPSKPAAATVQPTLVRSTATDSTGVKPTSAVSTDADLTVAGLTGFGSCEAAAGSGLSFSPDLVEVVAGTPERSPAPVPAGDCGIGCCSSGTGCCGAILLPSAQSRPVAVASAPLAPLVVGYRSGIDPDVLARPPRFSA